MPRQTIKQIQAQIKATNKAFAKLTPAEKRVAIARDVIEQTVLGKFQAKQGTYAITNNPLSHTDLNNDASLMYTRAERCTVCGIGGLFISAVCKADKLPVSELAKDIYETGDYLEVQGGSAHAYLQQFFDGDTLNNIEGAFEQRNDFGGDWGCAEFAMDVEDDNDRLRLIMENIIVNNGEFDFNTLPKEKTVWYTEGFTG